MQGQGFEYGGVKFTKNVPDDAIRTFVSRLSEDKRKDLREVVYELEDAGLITIEIPGEAPEPLAAPEPPTPARVASPPAKASTRKARTRKPS